MNFRKGHRIFIGQWRNYLSLPGLCRFRKLDSCISMVKPAKDRMRDNLSEPLDRTCAGRVLPKRKVSSRFIIIDGVFFKNPPKVFGVEHDQMIRALASDRSDQPF